MEGIRISNIALASPGLAINAGSSTLAKVANAVNFKIDGNIYTTTSGTISFAGITLATAYTQAFIVTANASGTIALTAGSAVLTSSITNGIFPVSSLPAPVAGSATLGYIIIKNATGSTFTGGTTALDTASLTVTYINVQGLGSLSNA